MKNMPCPHCRLIGCLIRHGFLRGYTETANSKEGIRGRRFFCSNRKKRQGCGSTFSILFYDLLKRVAVGARSLWRFFEALLAGMSQMKAFDFLALPFSFSTLHRLYRRFKNNQTRLRSRLSSLIKPPPSSLGEEPEHQTLRHLQDAFPDSACPLAEFQRTFQISFI